MKNFSTKFWGCVIALLALLPAMAQQQDELQGFQGFSTPKPMRNAGILKFSIIPIFEGQIDFTGELRVTYEHKIAKRQSITIGASYDYPNFILLGISNAIGGRGGGRPGGHGGRSTSFNAVSVEGGRITLGYRYYPLKEFEGLKGFFVGPYLSFNSVNIRIKNNSQNYEVINYADAAAITGYQFVFAKHFELELFGGLGYKNNFVGHYNTAANDVYRQYALPQIPGLTNVKLVAQMNLGYAF